jgi:hypothetical protein
MTPDELKKQKKGEKWLKNSPFLQKTKGCRDCTLMDEGSPCGGHCSASFETPPRSIRPWERCQKCKKNCKIAEKLGVAPPLQSF